MASRPYTVAGHWPFPLDMLRHDLAVAATPEDARLIERLSGDVTDNGFGLRGEPVSVNLIMEGGPAAKHYPFGHHMPNDQRWRSFGWKVIDGDTQMMGHIGWQDRHQREAALRRAALTKLTPEEREVLGLDHSDETTPSPSMKQESEG